MDEEERQDEARARAQRAPEDRHVDVIRDDGRTRCVKCGESKPEHAGWVAPCSGWITAKWRRPEFRASEEEK
jgi:hypothetical protein